MCVFIQYFYPLYLVLFATFQYYVVWFQWVWVCSVTKGCLFNIFQREHTIKLHTDHILTYILTLK